MDPITQFEQLVGSRAAYPLVAMLLTFALQIGRKSPYTKDLAAKIPDGWRWITPALAGAVIGFTHGYQQGRGWVGALAEAGFGLCGVSLPSMGLAAALKESVLPWDGGAGGKSSNGGPPA